MNDAVMTYHGQVGEHIREATAKAMVMATLNSCDVEFTFNDVTLTVTSTSIADEVLALYNQKQDEQAAAWRASPAGVAYAAEVEQSRMRNQAEHDELMTRFPLVVSNEPDLMAWLGNYAEVADNIHVVGKDYPKICDLLMAQGYVKGDAVGLAKDQYKIPTIMARYVIGQAMSCMMDQGMPPHPVTSRFVQQYQDLLA